MIDAAVRPESVISLCAGYGGLELALRAACPGIRLVAAVERQAYAAAVLANRMEEGAMDPCPVFDTLESFDCAAYRGRVDLVAAGFPCQGASVAGKRLGTDDERWLWPEVWRITREVGAAWLLAENVPGLLSVNGGRAFEEILRDLASLGWSARWDCIPAGAVGAPHVRDRFFLLAADANRVRVRVESERDQRTGGGVRAAEREPSEPDDDGEERRSIRASRGGSRQGADAPGERREARESQHGRSESPRRVAERGDRETSGSRQGADADSEGCDRERSGGQLDGGIGETCGSHVDRRGGSHVDRRGGSHVDRRGGPRARFAVEDIGRIVDAGRAHWDWRRSPEPCVRGVADELAAGLDIDTHAEQLHLLGNGCIPAQAAVEIILLWDRLHGTALADADDSNSNTGDTDQ